MNAEQAWQSVLGQLQMEMPRASFNDARRYGGVRGVLTHGIDQQLEEADLPLGLAIALNSPVPIWKQIDIDIPVWQYQVMEAISWDEE
jgi:hypothetical protein